MSKTYGAISHLIVPSPFITISGGPRICVQNLHKQITRALTSSRNSLCWWYSMGIRNVERWWWWSVGVPNGVYCVTLPLSVASANFSTFSLDGFFLFALTTNWCLNLCKCNYIITSILPVKCVAPFCEWVCVCVHVVYMKENHIMAWWILPSFWYRNFLKIARNSSSSSSFNFYNQK